MLLNKKKQKKKKIKTPGSIAGVLMIGFVTLFNGLSTFMCYLMPKLSLQNSNDIT